MKFRKYVIESKGIKFLPTNPSINVINKLVSIRGVEEIKVILDNNKLNTLKEIFAPVIASNNVPSGRQNFVKWLTDGCSENIPSSSIELAQELINIGATLEIGDVKLYLYTNVKEELESENIEINDSTFISFPVQDNDAIIISNNFLYNNFITLTPNVKTLERNSMILMGYILFNNREELETKINELYGSRLEGSLLQRLMCAIADSNNYVPELRYDALNASTEGISSDDNLWDIIDNNYDAFTDLSLCNQVDFIKAIWNFSKPDVSTRMSILNYLLSAANIEPCTYSKETEGILINYNWNGRTLECDAVCCPTCGKIMPTTENFVLIKPNGSKLCKNCISTINYRTLDSDRMLSYHSRTVFNPMQPCGDKPSEKSRYGMELELKVNGGKRGSSYYSDWLPKWWTNIAPIIYGNGNTAKIERDGSLGDDGEEMISQPLSKEFVLGNQMKEWINAVKDLYHTADCCGLHFHVDKDALSAEQWGKLLRFFTNHYDDFVEARIFRPTNHYNDLSQLKRFCEQCQGDKELFYSFCNNVSHYSSISCSSHTGKTIEFRCFASTVDYDTFMRCIKTIMMMMDNVDVLCDCKSLVVLGGAR